MPTPTPINIFPLFTGGFALDYPLLVSLLARIWWFFALFLILGITWVAIKFYQHQRLANSGIFEIDHMTGEQFEQRLQILFTNLGYKAQRTNNSKSRPDYGADLVIEKDGIKTVVQAKRWRGWVGEDAVRQAYSAMNYYKCTQAMVVTNSNFSQMAWQLAKSNNVKLWNRNHLINVLLTEKLPTN
jgi:restriction system protein